MKILLLEWWIKYWQLHSMHNNRHHYLWVNHKKFPIYSTPIFCFAQSKLKYYQEMARKKWSVQLCYRLVHWLSIKKLSAMLTIGSTLVTLNFYTNMKDSNHANRNVIQTKCPDRMLSTHEVS